MTDSICETPTMIGIRIIDLTNFFGNSGKISPWSSDGENTQIGNIGAIVCITNITAK